jgi:hypothetical protein
VLSPESLESALRANIYFLYEKTAIEAIVVAASERENQFVIGLMSLKNGKLLSFKNKELYASTHNLSELILLARQNKVTKFRIYVSLYQSPRNSSFILKII